jgi:hypothetical protein
LFISAVVLAMFAGLSSAQRPPDDIAQRMAYDLRLSKIEERAQTLRPRRRDTPMRELNITDNEVREVEVVAHRYLMKSMLNISPVIAGCACEEGPLCTDQVYVVATTATQTVSLQLSRIRNAWAVGPVQKWWFRYEILREKGPKMDWLEYQDAKNQLLLDFPMCVGKDDSVEPIKTAAQTRDATKKK